jgi:hypothetical protein
MSALTDVEISRALNAVSCTLRDQRPQSFDPARVNEIALGALAGEPKLSATATGTASGELRKREDGRLVARIELQEGQWVVQRELKAGESSWALPQPAHEEAKAGEGEEEAAGGEGEGGGE